MSAVVTVRMGPSGSDQTRPMGWTPTALEHQPPHNLVLSHHWLVSEARRPPAVA